MVIVKDIKKNKSLLWKKRNKMSYRINKAIARLGICSRRDADYFISSGFVFLNGKLCDSFNSIVNFGDVVKIKDKEYKFEESETLLYKFYKPIGCITTKSDPQGRLSVYDLIPKEYRNLICIGRLDYNTEGLLLFTNDGEFSRKMCLPENNFERVYRIRIYGELDRNIANSIKEIAKKGIFLDGIKYKSFDIFFDNINLNRLISNHWAEIIIKEGKNREVRKIMDYFGFEVNRLIRIKFGKYILNDINECDFIEIKL